MRGLVSLADCIILAGQNDIDNGWVQLKRTLGQYRIASSLEEAGYETFVLDFIQHFSSDEIISVLSKHLTDKTLWVGFSSTFFWTKESELSLTPSTESMYYTKYQEVLKVLKYIKTNSNAKLIYGGSKTPYFLEIDEFIDCYVTGNADVSIIKVTDNIMLGKTERFVDSLKYPEPDVKTIHTKISNVLHGETLPIELARGCIFKCKFCSYPLLGKKKGTYLRDFSQVKDEMIEYWETNKVDTYYITDDTFNDDNDKIEELHKIFTSLPFKPKFASYLRIDLLNKFPHQAKLLQEMGLVGTFFGLETLQPDSAKAIGKGLHPNKVIDRLYWLNEEWDNKVNIEAGFILGLPHDSMSYFNELIDWSMKSDNPVHAIRFYPLSIVKNSNVDLDRYSSDFSLNHEAYGYTFNNFDDFSWNLRKKLSFDLCKNISDSFNQLRSPRNKYAGFGMVNALSVGYKLDDLYTYTQKELLYKYNVKELERVKVDEYKRIIGL